jgi:amino acid transporter
MAAAKTLGFADLFFYAASTSLSIRWISVAAAAGPASLWIWVLAVVVFSGPLIMATAELTSRFPGEGGVYDWTAEAFGPFWGFLCGWLYWVCNLPFFSAMLVFMLNLLALAIGRPGKALLGSPWLFTSAAVALSLVVGALHYLGMGTGKWLSNVGGAANFVLVALLAAVAALVLGRQAPATDFTRAGYAPPLDADGAILWATMVFGVGGTEALAFLRNDVRGGMPTILGVLACVALVQIAFYLTGTAALLAILSPAAATRLSGLPDALIAGLKALGLGAAAPLALVGGFLCLLGSYSAWFGVAARLPFAAGIDAVLPRAFGRRHPRSGAPVVSIAVQTIVVALIVVLSQAGETLKATYDFLVAMSVLSYTLPFLFLFAVFLKAPRGRVSLSVGLVGMAATVVAVLCTLVPSPDARNQLFEAAKLVFASAMLIVSGVLAYLLATGGRIRGYGRSAPS